MTPLHRAILATAILSNRLFVECESSCLWHSYIVQKWLNIGLSTNYSQPASRIFRVFSYTYECGEVLRRGSRKLSSERHTDRQTNRHDRNYIPRRFAGGQQCFYASNCRQQRSTWVLYIYARICLSTTTNAETIIAARLAAAYRSCITSISRLSHGLGSNEMTCVMWSRAHRKKTISNYRTSRKWQEASSISIYSSLLRFFLFSVVCVITVFGTLIRAAYVQKFRSCRSKCVINYFPSSVIS